MRKIKEQYFDEERALYGSRDLELEHCYFDGPADGESAIKECQNVVANQCFFNLRYPFWHVNGLKIDNSEMTPLCRAALWYSRDISIAHTKMNGIKALRECQNVQIFDCNILSPEFGWSAKNVEMKNTTAESEYFMMRAMNLHFENVKFQGKYSFQYIEGAMFEKCDFDTKDAFWHGKDIVVKDSVIKGEYLAWYSDGLTLENCKIIGTQPFCYCKNLKLIHCEMIDTDLCFEKSEVEATISSSVISIKNPKSGKIEVSSLGEFIHDDDESKAEVIVNEK